MFLRLPLLLLLLLGLALGPLRAAALCGKQPDIAACHACCADPTAACCATSCGSVPLAPLAQTGAAADAGKQLLPPTFVFAGFCAAPVVKRPAVYRRQTARMPVVARLDLICVRLI